MSDMHLDADSLPGTLKIAGDLTIATGCELHTALTGHLGRGRDLALDLSGILVCDTAGLQLLYALRQSVVLSGEPIHIASVSKAIEETSAALGLRLEEVLAKGGHPQPRGAEVGI